ncbi:MAG: hypothetical protein ACRDRJ_46630 [Streptosporangiaceae bacterium]
MPNGGSNRFTVTSGITNFSGGGNVVSGTGPGAPGQQGTPLDVNVQEINCTLGPHCGYSFFIKGWVEVVPTTAAGQPSPIPTLAGTRTAADPSGITDFFENLVKDKAKSFIMDQLGIQSSEQSVEELKAKIDQLSQNITAIGAQLNQAIVEFRFDVIARELTKITNGLDTTYTIHLRQLADDVLKVKQAEATHDPAKISSAMAIYNTHKQSFITAGGSADGFTGALQDIHSLLQPRLGQTPFLYDLGDLILVRHRYLTSADSAVMQEVYNYAQEYQALAAE